MINRRILKGIPGFAILPTIAHQKHAFLEYAKANFMLNHWERGLIPFEEYDYHRSLLNIYENNTKVIVKKYRQGGFSSFNVLYALYECLNKEQSYLFATMSDRHALELSRIAYTALEYMQVAPGVELRNDHEIRFQNGSRMIFRGVRSGFMQGSHANCVFVEEFAFYQEPERILQMLYADKLIINSSPNGKKNYFYKLYKNSDFTKFSPSYVNHPMHQNKSELKYNLGQMNWRSEILTEFV